MPEVPRSELNRRRALLASILVNTPQPIVPNVQGRTFTSFMRLPVELRDMVWELQLPGPRTITITEDVDRKALDINDLFIRVAKASKTPVPTLLHICKESRDFARRFYRLSFEIELGDRPIYFDFERDLLFIPNERHLRAFYGRDSLKERPETLRYMAETEASIQRLQIDTTCFAPATVPMICRFRNLKTLTLSSVYRAPSIRLRPHTEKLLVRGWKKNAKAGGWELKIPKLDLGPGLGIGPELPIRDMAE